MGQREILGVHDFSVLSWFESCPQDSVAVTVILQDVFVTFKEQRPELEKVYCKQDNAGCYHCVSTIVGSTSASGVLGIKVERFDFSDPQGGKGEADRQPATIKGHISIYLNEGHTAQMKEAIVKCQVCKNSRIVW